MRLASRSLRRPRVGCATNALLRPAALRAAFVRPLATATDAAKPADAPAAPAAPAAPGAATAAAVAAGVAKASADAKGLTARKRDLVAALQARGGDLDGSAIGSAWKAAIQDTAAAVAAADTMDDAQAVADNGVAERMDTFYGDFWAVTNERLSALDDILKGRSAAVVLTEFENPHDLWSRAVAVATARKQHRDQTQYGATLGATQFPAAPTGAEADKLNTGKLSGRTFADRKAELEARAKADAVLLDAAEKAAPELKDKLMHMRREWGTELKPSSARNAPAEIWRATLAKKYPNLSWDEIQRELRDTDADFWSPLDPSPPQWTWRIQPSLYRRPETTEGETRQKELTEKFNSMVEPPWVMHETRSVNVMSRGKQQAFKCLVFAGNNNGFGGYSIGRGDSPHKAQERAWKTLMNHMIFLPRLNARTLFHNVEGRFNRIRARFMCRKPGSGNKAPDFGMIVLNGFGLDDVSLSLHGGSNPYSWMHAIFDGLLQQTSNRARALARGQRLYRELDYNDIPVPAPDEAEWEAQTERVRDAVIDQVYINPIVYPERMATDEEKRNAWSPAGGPLPHKGFAKPYHQVHVKSNRPQWVTPGVHSERYRAWAGQRDAWQIATLHEAERGTFASVERNKA